MCVYSMVLDNFRPKFDSYFPVIQTNPPFQWDTSKGRIDAELDNLNSQMNEIKTLINDFKKALDAALVVDKLTNQPDCEDPEKKVLVDKVKDLEKRIAKMEKESKWNLNL